MGCGCQHKERGNYEHTKELARKFAKADKIVLAIYQVGPGEFSFIDISCPEYADITPIEYITPLF